ncbi:MAG: hypothetical protein ABIY55_33030 [Kofleriaceae bacterium]
MKLLSIAILAVLCTSAHAELRPQLQADLGLSVVAVGYEHPIGAHTTVMVGGGLFGTYFLPWFSLGDNVIGGVGDLRFTWFHGDDGHGFYVTPYVRAGYASGSDETTKLDGAGVAVTGGVFIGYAFALTDRLDLRLGAGAQYIYVGGDHDVGASTPFVALDTALGWRL